MPANRRHALLRANRGGPREGHQGAARAYPIGQALARPRWPTNTTVSVLCDDGSRSSIAAGAATQHPARPAAHLPQTRIGRDDVASPPSETGLSPVRSVRYGSYGCSGATIWQRESDTVVLTGSRLRRAWPVPLRFRRPRACRPWLGRLRRRPTAILWPRRAGWPR